MDLRVITASLMIKNKVKNKGYDTETSNAVNLVFNKYLSIREDIINKQKVREAKELNNQEAENREYAKQQQEFNKRFKGVFNNISETDNYTDKQKEYLKIIYKSSAMKLHPDITKDNGEGMQFLNELKDQWGLNEKR